MHLNDVEDAEFRRLTEQIEGTERRNDLCSSADRIFSASQSTNGNTMSTTQYRRESEVYNARSGHDFVRDLLQRDSGWVGRGA